MNILIPFLIASIAGLSTILGNIVLFVNLKYKENLLSFSLGLSFLVMFLISVLELVPDGLLYIYDSIPNILYLFMYGLFWLFIGYIIVFILDRFISNDDSLYKIGVLSMISLLIHNIPEGLICSLSSYMDYNLGIRVCLMIMIHNIPEGICISLPIYYSTKSRGKAFLMTLVSSLGEILGAFVGIVFVRSYINEFIMSIILIITAGIMISLSVGKVLKESIKYKRYKWLIFGIFVGLCIICLTL